MHDGTIFEVSESRSESTAAESGFEAPVLSCGEAKALGHHWKMQITKFCVCYQSLRRKIRGLWGIVMKKKGENGKWMKNFLYLYELF